MLVVFWNIRVSTRFPSNRNSLKSFVPTGKVHSFGLLMSIRVAGGSSIQRCFCASSDHRGVEGVYARAFGDTSLVAKSA